MVEAGDERRRLLALLEHKPWAADDGESWTAAFAWEGPKVEVSSTAELSVAPSVAVELPSPTPRGGRVRAPKSGAGGRSPGRTGPRIAAHGERRVETLERDLTAAQAELEELRAEHDRVARAARAGGGRAAGPGGRGARAGQGARGGGGGRGRGRRRARPRSRRRATRPCGRGSTRWPSGMPRPQSATRRSPRGTPPSRQRQATVKAARDAVAKARAEAVQAREALTAERDEAVRARDAVAAERDEAVQAREAMVAERDAALQARDATQAEGDAATGDDAGPRPRSSPPATRRSPSATPSPRSCTPSGSGRRSAARERDLARTETAPPAGPLRSRT